MAGGPPGASFCVGETGGRPPRCTPPCAMPFGWEHAVRARGATVGGPPGASRSVSDAPDRHTPGQGDAVVRGSARRVLGLTGPVTSDRGSVQGVVDRTGASHTCQARPRFPPPPGVPRQRLRTGRIGRSGRTSDQTGTPMAAAAAQPLLQSRLRTYPRSRNRQPNGCALVHGHARVRARLALEHHPKRTIQAQRAANRGVASGSDPPRCRRPLVLLAVQP